MSPDQLLVGKVAIVLDKLPVNYSGPISDTCSKCYFRSRLIHWQQIQVHLILMYSHVFFDLYTYTSVSTPNHVRVLVGIQV